MSWVKLPDEFADDPRWETAGTEAFALHVAAMCYCMRQLTDGILPAPRARRLWPVEDPDVVVAALVDHGFWKPTESGYELIGFLDTQRSAENIRAERSKVAERQRRWYEKTREAKKVPNGVRNGVTNPSSNGSANGPPAQPSPARNEVRGRLGGLRPSAGAPGAHPPAGVGTPTGPITITSKPDPAVCGSCTREVTEVDINGRCGTCALVHEQEGGERND
jgi:hypothetical protein